MQTESEHFKGSWAVADLQSALPGTGWDPPGKPLQAQEGPKSRTPSLHLGGRLSPSTLQEGRPCKEALEPPARVCLEKQPIQCNNNQAERKQPAEEEEILISEISLD